jgi:uncharacterized protein with GYD domain
MPTFISLLTFTEQGVAKFKDTAKRADAFAKAAAAAGVTVRENYWTMGGYDGVLIFDAPDEAGAAAAMVSLVAKGNVLTETMRAFGRDEIGGVLGLVN